MNLNESNYKQLLDEAQLDENRSQQMLAFAIGAAALALVVISIVVVAWSHL